MFFREGMGVGEGEGEGEEGKRVIDNNQNVRRKDELERRYEEE